MGKNYGRLIVVLIVLVLVAFFVIDKYCKSSQAQTVDAPSILMDIKSMDDSANGFVVGRAMIGSSSFYIVRPSDSTKEDELIDITTVLLEESNVLKPQYMRCTPVDGCSFEFGYVRKLIVPIGYTAEWHNSMILLDVAI